jgi:3'-phosphoadenosine 5'-phosphosulfate sulfotransferase (PAPS reductase)/FAD synthetase
MARDDEDVQVLDYPVWDDILQAHIPDLPSYHWILVNSSAGKDSQAMLDFVVELCDRYGVPRSRIVVVHCDLGFAEWEGTRELAQEQAEHYGLRFVTVMRDGVVFQGRVLGDLFEQTVERWFADQAKGKDNSPWPSLSARWCTSDQKTAQVAKLMTALKDEVKNKAGWVRHPVTGEWGKDKVRILNCLGLRAQESDERAQKPEFVLEKKPSNTLKDVHRWLPIKHWDEEQVWDRIWASGVRYHWAYEKGMERLSCCFCVLASPRDWAISIKYNRKVAEHIAEIEDVVGHAIKEPQKGAPISMRDILAAADRAEAEKVSA